MLELPSRNYSKSWYNNLSEQLYIKYLINYVLLYESIKS